MGGTLGEKPPYWAKYPKRIRSRIPPLKYIRIYKNKKQRGIKLEGILCGLEEATSSERKGSGAGLGTEERNHNGMPG